MDLSFENQKANVGIRINILQMPGVPIFRQSKQFWLFQPKFAQNWILGSEFEKSKSGFGIRSSKIPSVPIFSQNGQLSVFQPKFGEFALLRAIFLVLITLGELGGGWHKLGGGGWSKVEVEMSWVELDGAGWKWMHSLVIPFFYN